MDAPMSDRAKLMLVWPVAGFFVVIAFGVGLISMATFDSRRHVRHGHGSHRLVRRKSETA